VLVAVTSWAAGCGNDDQGGQARNLGEDESTGTTVKEGTGTTVSGNTATTVAGSGAACEVQGGVATKGADVAVTLTEWKVVTGVAQAAPGIVSFLAENSGKEDHELVVVQAESVEGLPTDAAGAMDETRLADGALIGEIEPMAPATICRGNFALPAGRYVLLCNVVEKKDDGTTESHFAEGMHTPFTVAS
jgi:hypothetical protein